MVREGIPENQVLTIAQAAQALETSEQNLRRLITDNQIKGYRTFGNTLVFYGDLIAYIKSKPLNEISKQ
jgi:excisionase family DNA binding protein